MEKRTRDTHVGDTARHVCSHCGESFAYVVRRGKRPAFCSEEHRRARRRVMDNAIRSRRGRYQPAGHIFNGYHRLTIDGRQVLKHRLVMEQMIGRPLLPAENVHHVNGDRTDNRLENLELWTKSQPSGQRVTDKVEWAVELLKLYAPERLS